ncbi:MAG: hypothetical protein N3G20_09410 [Verrucomicrobiae bacterium]|nr:hypothetical protein [Verrucomicrobiae bacterium]
MVSKNIGHPPEPKPDPAGQGQFWAGGTIAIIGLFLIVVGLRHVTGVETLEGDFARETQLVRAFTTGGLKYDSQAAPAESPGQATPRRPGAIPGYTDQANPPKPPRTGRVRVDPTALTPCPT